VELILHVTGLCNLRCTYCHEGAGKRTSTQMAPDTARRAVEFLFRRPGDKHHLYLYGGEPLTVPATLTAAVERVRSLEAQAPSTRCTISLTTNATLLDDRWLDWATQQSVLVGVSMDGTRAAQDGGRPFPDGTGSWEVVVTNLRLLLRKQPHALVRSTYTPDNAGELPDSFDELLDLGARCLVGAPDLESLAWTPESIRRLQDAYEEVARRYARRTLAGEHFWFGPFDGRLLGRVRGRMPHRCDAGDGQLSVAPDGTLLPCKTWVADTPEPSMILGHIDTGLDQGAVQRFCAASRRPRPECAGCAIQVRCVHGCACLDWRSTGRLSAASPLVCAHERMLNRVADELAASLVEQQAPVFLQKLYNPLYPLLVALEQAGVPPSMASALRPPSP